MEPKASNRLERRWRRGGPIIDRLNRLDAGVDRWTARVLPDRWSQPVTNPYRMLLVVCGLGIVFVLGLSAVPLLFGRADVTRRFLPWVLWILAQGVVLLVVTWWKQRHHR